MAPPSTQKSWTVSASENAFDGLTLNEQASVPELGDSDVLVKFHAASLNYRDLIIAKGKYPFPVRDGVVPVSDGAGEVVAVGKNVYRFKEGDKIATLFSQGHIGGSINAYAIGHALGGTVDGALREYGRFDQQGLVLMPESLNYVEAATLPCAGLTAWNALYGLESRSVKPGDFVLVLGTGGVSLFGLQFAKAAGARVIATTSSAAKEKRLKELGADHVLNYKEVSDWGVKAKELTGGVGVNHILEVGGSNSMAQSLKAIAIDGVISVIGFLGGEAEKQPTLLDCLFNVCTVRGVAVGSRQQMEDMNRAINANKIKPVVDAKIFKLTEAEEAFQYMWEQKHFGNLTLTCSE